MSSPALFALRTRLLAGLGSRARVRVPHRRQCVVVEIRGSVEAGREGLRNDIAHAAPGTEVVSIGPAIGTLHGGLSFPFECYLSGTVEVPVRGGEWVESGVGA